MRIPGQPPPPPTSFTPVSPCEQETKLHIPRSSHPFSGPPLLPPALPHPPTPSANTKGERNTSLPLCPANLRGTLHDSGIFLTHFGLSYFSSPSPDTTPPSARFSGSRVTTNFLAPPPQVFAYLTRQVLRAHSLDLGDPGFSTSGLPTHSGIPSNRYGGTYFSNTSPSPLPSCVPNIPRHGHI